MRLALDILFRVTLNLGVAILIFMLALTVLDVSLRYLVNKPIYGATEITQFAMALLIFAGLAVITREKSHIVVSLFEPFMLRRCPVLYKALFSAFNLVGTAVLAYLLLTDGFYLISIEQITIVLELQQGYYEVAMGIFALIATVFGVEQAIRDFREHASDPHKHETGM